MGKKPLLALVDGKFTPSLDCPARAVVSGDNLIPAIMAASILAKTARDRWMIRYSWIEGAYGYDRHKGYPTPEHARICRELGPSPISRLSFRVPGEKDPPRRRTG
jgi:ribonuclease HII